MTVTTAKSLSRARLVSCVLINQCATPGLGSLMARRILAGTCQLLLALAGFALITGGMFELFYGSILRQLGEPAPKNAPDWMWKWGCILFGAAWLWSLATSLSLLKQAKAGEQTAQQGVPPRLAGLPDKP